MSDSVNIWNNILRQHLYIGFIDLAESANVIDKWLRLL